jgi:hypothetical protein
MANVRAADVPPPGGGFATLTWAVPAVATSAAVIDALTALLLTNIVVRAAPFHCTVAPCANPLPLTVRSKAPLPATMLAGLSEAISGAPAVIAKETAAEVPPPGVGFTTVTWAVPTLATSATAIPAVSIEALTYVVARAEPFHWTVESSTNPDPFTVSANALPPAVTELGERELIAGTGFLLFLLLSLLQPASDARHDTKRTRKNWLRRERDRQIAILDIRASLAGLARRRRSLEPASDDLQSPEVRGPSQFVIIGTGLVPQG